MPVAESAFLCQSVMTHDGGLFSALGVGISTFTFPSLPAIASFTFVAVMKWTREESDQTHACVVRVTRGDETVARVDVPAAAMPWAEGVGPQTNVFCGVSFDVRREGLYRVVLSSDAEEICDLPLEVQSQMPLM